MPIEIRVVDLLPGVDDRQKRVVEIAEALALEICLEARGGVWICSRDPIRGASPDVLGAFRIWLENERRGLAHHRRLNRLGRGNRLNARQMVLGVIEIHLKHPPNVCQMGPAGDPIPRRPRARKHREQQADDEHQNPDDDQ